MDTVTPLVASALAAAIPLLLAALGELIVERSGVLNLGIEGMMLLGAVAAFATVTMGGGLFLAVLAGIGAGMLAAALFGLLTITLQANQVATGLALTILGTGVSAFVGRSYVGFRAAATFDEWRVPFLADLPIVGPFFSMTVLGYATLALLLGITWFLTRTRAGLMTRAVGESPAVARALGMRVTRVRYAATLFGGAMAGLAGCDYAVAQFKMWQEGLTSGNGWIALALVVFATWRPLRVAAGALLFGGVSAFGLYLQAIGIHVSPFVLGSLPYVATIVMLVFISSNRRVLLRDTPVSLGKPFFDGD